MRLLDLYPRRWRERYGPEMRALLDRYPVRPWTLADLLAGALRARLDHRRETKEATMARGRSGDLRCSFCGKDRDSVRRLISGPGVYICDGCVQLCNEVLARTGPPQPPAPAAPPRRARPGLPLLVRTWLRNLFRTVAPDPG